MPAAIRLAEAADAAAVTAIYAPIVRDTCISFEYDVPDADEMRRRILDTLGRWPWLICVRQGVVLGYAYASPHRGRAAYRWSVDTSVYVDSRWRRHGVGRALYGSLFALLRLQGYCNAYAGIALPNPASVALHEAQGFRPVGVYREVGFKHGGWHDVGWWALALQAKPSEPRPPCPLAAAQALPAWHAALTAGEPLLRDAP